MNPYGDDFFRLRGSKAVALGRKDETTLKVCCSTVVLLPIADLSVHRSFNPSSFLPLRRAAP